MGTLGVVGSAVTTGYGSEGDEHDVDDEPDDDVDEPEGFEVEVIAEHATFTDDVAAMFTLDFADEDDEPPNDVEPTDDVNEDGWPIGVHLDDASNAVFLEAHWEPAGTSGWHRHPGPVFVTVLEGELELVWERGGVTRTYAAGEAFLDPGEVHTATNVSDDEEARVLALALGVPDDEPVTEWVEPADS